LVWAWESCSEETPPGPRGKKLKKPASEKSQKKAEFWGEKKEKSEVPHQQKEKEREVSPKHAGIKRGEKKKPGGTVAHKSNLRKSKFRAREGGKKKGLGGGRLYRKDRTVIQFQMRGGGEE